MGVSASRVGEAELNSLKISWYRSPLSPEVSARVHARSDARALLHTAAWVGLLLAWAAAAQACAWGGRPLAAAAFCVLYGLHANFSINAMHELGHGTAFSSRALAAASLRLVSFLGWHHPDLFFSSHRRHHLWTQWAPQDQENPMPIRPSLAGFLSFGFVNAAGAAAAASETLRAALGVYPTGYLGWLPEWEARIYADDPAARLPAARWAWCLLLGHGALAAACAARGAYLLPLCISLGPFHSGWLFWLCNSTQHVGLQPRVPDFRRNSRTFYLHPLLRFLYFNMNYHIEHHMYAAVPFYHLPALHEAIKHDLPPTPHGIAEVWRIIAEDVRQQARDPEWTQPVALPLPAQPAAAAAVAAAESKKSS